MKFSFLVIASFLSVAYGADEMKMLSLENRVSRLEKNQLKLEESSHVAKEGFDIDRDVALSVEGLYWGIREDGLGFVIKGVKGSDTITNIPQQIEYLDWNWTGGVRAMARFNMGYDTWDAGVTYTYYNNNSHKKKGVSALSDTAGQKVLLTVWSAILGPGEANYASMQYHFNLNEVDFDVSRGFWLSPSVVFRPAFGIRGARLDSHSKVFYSTQYSAVSTHYHDTVNLTQHTKALGPKGNLDTEWYVNRIFSIYFNLGFGLLWGNFSMTQHEEFENVVTDASTSMKYKNSYLSTLPVVDMVLGMRAGFWFWDNKAHLEFNAGWDQHLWFNYNKMQKTVNHNTTLTYTGLYSESNGNLTLSGLSAGVRLDF
ncbi:MAG: hypothetical protein KBC64_00565 [Simkaniaceae bacterium]|nr:hypothetical protein [Simkaniaceae bacterium]